MHLASAMSRAHSFTTWKWSNLDLMEFLFAPGFLSSSFRRQTRAREIALLRRTRRGRGILSLFLAASLDVLAVIRLTWPCFTLRQLVVARAKRARRGEGLNNISNRAIRIYIPPSNVSRLLVNPLGEAAHPCAACNFCSENRSISLVDDHHDDDGSFASEMTRPSEMEMQSCSRYVWISPKESAAAA